MLHPSIRSEVRTSALTRGALFSIILVIVSLGARADVSIPDTPAGHTLQAFLSAFNSGEHDRIAAYVKEYDPENNADRLTSFSGQTGGFTLVSIVHSTADKLIFLVHGRGDNIDAYGVLQLASTAPPRVKTLGVRAIPPNAKLDDIQLDEATRQKTIDAISKRLTEYYVYPDVAAKMIQAMRDHQKHGDYNSIVEGNEFADALSRDLRNVSHDQHLFIGYNPFTLPDQSGSSSEPRPPSPADQARFRTMLEHQNCTFSKLEILNHNIGYVKFGAFPDPDICAPTVVAAMNFLAHTDALIFDLRENHGGDPSMVDFMVSYLFREPTHINDLTNRHDNETHQYWTLPWVPGSRFVDQPVYVLTSHETFSGGEEFTFDLKTQKRATIVGETTGGGAHPVQGMPAGDHFTVGVPFGRPINPVTKGDWEGKGVEPDVKVSAADALTTAEKLAADKLATKNVSVDR
jgi:Peptidase family S41/N-terminal domain of Peptidase_S41 in eukaryotic IRBP